MDSTAGETYTQRRNLKVPTEETIKKQLAALTEGVKHVQQIIGEKQQKEFNDWLEFMKSAEEKLQTLSNDITELGEWIAPIAQDLLAEVQLMCSTTRGLCNTINETGECQDFHGFLTNMAEFKKGYINKKCCIERTVKVAHDYQKNYKKPPVKKPRSKKG